MLTTDRNDPNLGIVKENGQNEAYLILSEEERQKGFVRPLRTSYIHVGEPISGIESVEILDEEERKKRRLESGVDWYAFIHYRQSRFPITGRYLTKSEYDRLEYFDENGVIKGCGVTTIMAREIAETYARNPNFYGATYCSGCKKHLPLTEFHWSGTNETVGS